VLVSKVSGTLSQASDSIGHSRLTRVIEACVQRAAIPSAIAALPVPTTGGFWQSDFNADALGADRVITGPKPCSELRFS
jgi:hypothetical protein